MTGRVQDVARNGPTFGPPQNGPIPDHPKSGDLDLRSGDRDLRSGDLDPRVTSIISSVLTEDKTWMVYGAVYPLYTVYCARDVTPPHTMGTNTLQYIHYIVCTYGG
jgi:hypothetical protein